MKTLQSSESNVITAYQHNGFNIYVCDNPEGFFASIADADGEFIDATPFKNDIDSAKEAAENICTQLKQT